MGGKIGDGGRRDAKSGPEKWGFWISVGGGQFQCRSNEGLVNGYEQERSPRPPGSGLSASLAAQYGKRRGVGSDEC